MIIIAGKVVGNIEDVNRKRKRRLEIRPYVTRGDFRRIKAANVADYGKFPLDSLLWGNGQRERRTRQNL
jgi:hypothetical protein